MAEEGSSRPLRRALSLPLLTLYGVGTILGAGIYVLVGKVAGHAGMHTPIAFGLAAVLAALTGLSFAELGARLPKSAGEAVYVHEGLRLRWLALAVGLFIALSGVVSTATMAVGFHGYLAYFFDLPRWLTITALVLALTILACWGIAQSALVAAAITCVEVGGLLLILAVAGDAVAEAPSRAAEIGLPAPGAWAGIFVGAFLAFYAFIGFEDMVNVAEEVVSPGRDLPRAIFLAIGVTTLLYLAVSLVAVLALPSRELAASEAPLALIYARATGEAPWLITIISLFAVVNGALVQVIMAARVLYGMSALSWIPAPIGAVNRRTRTPVRATLLAGAAVLALALLLPLEGLAQITSTLILVVFTLVNLALWRLKKRAPRPAGAFSVPRPVPVAGALSCGGFLVLRLATAS